MPAPLKRKKLRRRIQISGRVQGVGFRPYVYKLATELGLTGFVGNDPQGVFIEVEGFEDPLQYFIDRLPRELPVLAEITGMDVSEKETSNDRAFTIDFSRASGRRSVQVAPDTATCPDCAKEIADPTDRRYRYPFANCTNCGPRYSIIKDVPYDRPATTMRDFPMCDTCQAEYENPLDRRFHAQPNACPVCGPRVWLTDDRGEIMAGSPPDGNDNELRGARRGSVPAIKRTLDMISEGYIVAIKGLGGFHLACAAAADATVALLRRRKGRESKPFALMVKDLDQARLLARIDDASAEALCSPAAPIVLCPPLENAPLSALVNPDCPTVGIMLAYTPLHIVLFDLGAPPLVMTSGNSSSEPICHRNDEALERLAGLADAFLFHDREIERPIDDSVVVVHNLGDSSFVVPVRRARGYVPAPVRVPLRSPAEILAVGGDLKSSVCFLKGDEAVLSEHLGELHNPRALRHYTRVTSELAALIGQRPTVVAHDEHPGYESTIFAASLDAEQVPVQHHHAHVVSCMAENGLEGKLIGLACDGTGLGTDGSVWGCEVLLADAAHFKRLASLQPFHLVGQDLAAIETWRPALSLVTILYGKDWRENTGSIFSGIDRQLLETAERLLSVSVSTSSLGRLFDAAAFLLGFCDRNRHEGQAAMAIEAAADRALRDTGSSAVVYPQSTGGDSMKEGMSNGGDRTEKPVLGYIDWKPVIDELVQKRLDGGLSTDELALRFHVGVAAALSGAVIDSAGKTGLNRVCLSGGCFINRILTKLTAAALLKAKLQVFVHHKVPTGDGGLALGQAVCAAARKEN